MELYVAGGCTEHGRNCFFVKEGKISFLVDCGIQKENPAQRYPLLDERRAKEASYLFLTHNHADHAGALLWLYEKGFRGKVIASAYTFSVIPGMIRGAKTLEELGKPLEKIRLEKGFHFRYGRSGHCTGGVWYAFSVNGKKILFSGDYCEKSVSFKCDPIRKCRADLAVIDCAYGEEKTDASENRKKLIRAIEEAAAQKKTMLFPVPFYGRGFDLYRILNRMDIPVYADDFLLKQLSAVQKETQWFRKGFRTLLQENAVRPLFSLQEDGTAKGILLADSQLAEEKNRELALHIGQEGGLVILTGKQEAGGFSRLLLDSKKAVFLRISVHQNSAEMQRLVKKNAFRTVVPFHCRQELKPEGRKYKVLRAGGKC